MKKLFLLVAAATMCLTATAQERSVWGVRAGVNISNMSQKMGDVSANADSKIGYLVGVSYQLPLVSKLFLETGLNATMLGYSLKAEVGKFKADMLYLQVPVALSWHFDLNQISIQPFVGGYYGYGIYGRAKNTEGGGKVKLFKKEGEIEKLLKNSDIGLRFGVGLTFKENYYLGAGYDMGLFNIAKNSGDAKSRNRNIFIALGYNF